MELKWHTRGELAPDGKQRVYICCHPEDQALYLAQLCKEVLDWVDCAVWYRADDETEVMEPAGFQLYVVPVTLRFLTTPNRGRAELELAAARHIPVLPLLQEPGLVEVFNHVCGELQCLDATGKTGADSGYRRQLHRFMQDVLLDSNKKERIRAEFDGKIFLSYRKKDRKQAEKLMKLLHRQDLCRDMAIWNDEYLIPGENFNETIAGALDSSDLFVLAVTPNVLKQVTNEQGEKQENYVVREEYRAANIRKPKLPVLPVEMVSTDGAKLAKKFPGMDQSVPWDDEAALSAALAEKLAGMPLRQKTEPMHDYLIGIAYLAGVDVEVDYDRALELIESAAERDCLDAICQLELMYREGFGVKRDPKTALKWFDRRVWYLWQQYCQEPGQENLMYFAREAWNYGKALEADGQSTGAQIQFVTAGQCLKDSPWADEPDIKEILAEILLSQGQLMMNWNQELAAELIENSVQIREELLAQSGSVRHERMLANARIPQGDIALALGRMDQARQHYRNGQAAYQGLWKREKDLKDFGNEGVAWERLAGLEMDEQNWDAAMEALQHCCANGELMHEVLGTEQTMRNLMLDKGRMADIYRKNGEPDKALEIYQKCAAEWDKLARETRSPSAYHNLGVAHERLGDVYRGEKQWDLARKHYHKARRVSEKLQKQVDVPRWRRSPGVAYDLLGVLYDHMGNRRRALFWYKKATTLFAQLYSAKRCPQTKEDLANAAMHLGNAQRGKAGLEELYIAKELWYMLNRDYPQVKRYDEGFAWSTEAFLEVLEEVKCVCSEEEINELLMYIYYKNRDLMEE